VADVAVYCKLKRLLTPKRRFLKICLDKDGSWKYIEWRRRKIMSCGDQNYGIWNTGCTSTTSNLTWGEYGYVYPNQLPNQTIIYQYVYDKEKKENPIIGGIDMKGLYDVYLIYAEDRHAPKIKTAIGVIADSDEDAKIKSGLMKEIDEKWDADYLTIIVNKIGDVKVKEKPKEVKQV